MSTHNIIKSILLERDGVFQIDEGIQRPQVTKVYNQLVDLYKGSNPDPVASAFKTALSVLELSKTEYKSADIEALWNNYASAADKQSSLDYSLYFVAGKTKHATWLLKRLSEVISAVKTTRYVNLYKYEANKKDGGYMSDPRRGELNAQFEQAVEVLNANQGITKQLVGGFYKTTSIKEDLSEFPDNVDISQFKSLSEVSSFMEEYRVTQIFSSLVPIVGLTEEDAASVVRLGNQTMDKVIQVSQEELSEANEASNTEPFWKDFGQGKYYDKFLEALRNTYYFAVMVRSYAGCKGHGEGIDWCTKHGEDGNSTDNYITKNPLFVIYADKQTNVRRFGLPKGVPVDKFQKVAQVFYDPENSPEYGDQGLIMDVDDKEISEEALQKSLLKPFLFALFDKTQDYRENYEFTDPTKTASVKDKFGMTYTFNRRYPNQPTVKPGNNVLILRGRHIDSTNLDDLSQSTLDMHRRLFMAEQLDPDKYDIVSVPNDDEFRFLSCSPDLPVSEVAQDIAANVLKNTFVDLFAPEILPENGGDPNTRSPIFVAFDHNLNCYPFSVNDYLNYGYMNFGYGAVYMGEGQPSNKDWLEWHYYHYFPGPDSVDDNYQDKEEKAVFVLSKRITYDMTSNIDSDRAIRLQKFILDASSKVTPSQTTTESRLAMRRLLGRK